MNSDPTPIDTGSRADATVNWARVIKGGQAITDEALSGRRPGSIRQHVRMVLAELHGRGRPEAMRQGRLAVRPLTDREVQILKLAGQGETNVGIANRLNLSVSTVNAAAAAINEKLCAVNRPNAIAVGFQLGLLS